MPPTKQAEWQAVYDRLERAYGFPLTEGDRHYLVRRGLVALAVAKQIGVPELEEELMIYRESHSYDARPARRLPPSKPKRRAGRVRGRLTDQTDFTGTYPERVRAYVLSGHIARMVARTKDVRSARLWLFGDESRVVSDPEAHQLLESPALQLMTKEEILALGAPLVGHWTSFPLRSSEVQNGSRVDYVQFTIQWDTGSHAVTHRAVWAHQNNRTLTYWDDSGEHERSVLVGSCHDKLRAVASNLARQFAWSEPAALRFLLTGEAPSLRAVSAQSTQHLGAAAFATINLTALAFASPKSVARAFSAAQERLLERSPRRPLEPKNLALFDFVAGQRKNPLPQLTWPQLLKEWNARIRRKWHYADFRSMRRDFERTAKLVTDPDFRGVERVSPGKRSGPKAPTA